MATEFRIELSEQRLELLIGRPASFTVAVFNASQVVAEYQVSVPELDPDWVTVNPPRVSLLPEQEGSVQVTILLPAQARAEAGERLVGVHVATTNGPEARRVEELDLHIPPTRAAAATLTVDPSYLTAGRSAHLTAHLDNRGANTPITVRLSGGDPEQKATVDVEPSTLVAPAFGSAAAKVTVHASPPWRGQRVQRTVALRAETPDDVLRASATLVQEPRFRPGRWVAALVLLVPAAIAAAVLLWPDQPRAADDPPAAEEVAEDADGGGDGEAGEANGEGGGDQGDNEQGDEGNGEDDQGGEGGGGVDVRALALDEGFPPELLDNCRSYDPTAATIVDQGSQGLALAADGALLARLDDAADAQAALVMARAHRALCQIGADADPPRSIVDVWVAATGATRAVANPDCLTHSPDAIDIRNQNGAFQVVSGNQLMATFGSAADAELMRSVASLHDRQCFIGRDNERANRQDFIVGYWLREGEQAGG